MVAFPEDLATRLGPGWTVPMHLRKSASPAGTAAYLKQDVERWGVLTIGTGLGNARFTNRRNGKDDKDDKKEKKDKKEKRTESDGVSKSKKDKKGKKRDKKKHKRKKDKKKRK